jgi:AraC-like DNA-binding protein
VAAGAGSLATAAVGAGYADQSHLGRECRRLTGSSPAAVMARWAAARRSGREAGRNVPDP